MISEFFPPLSAGRLSNGYWRRHCGHPQANQRPLHHRLHGFCPEVRLLVSLLTFPSGLTEPFGALLGGTFVLDASDEVIGLALSFAAGVMTYVTADEIISIAHER